MDFVPLTKNDCLAAHFCNNFPSSDIFDKDTMVSPSPEPNPFLSDNLVVTTPDLTQCRTCLFKVPQDTGDATKYDPQIKKWDVPCLQPSDESCLPFCAFPFTPSLPLWSLQTRSPRAYLHIFTFPPVFFHVAVGDVSQAFSVRNEQGGTNRLAKYENWITINGYVLLSAEDNDCVRT